MSVWLGDIVSDVRSSDNVYLKHIKMVKITIHFTILNKVEVNKPTLEVIDRPEKYRAQTFNPKATIIDRYCSARANLSIQSHVHCMAAITVAIASRRCYLSFLLFSKS